MSNTRTKESHWHTGRSRSYIHSKDEKFVLLPTTCFCQIILQNWRILNWHWAKLMVWWRRLLSILQLPMELQQKKLKTEWKSSWRRKKVLRNWKSYHNAIGEISGQSFLPKYTLAQSAFFRFAQLSTCSVLWSFSNHTWLADRRRELTPYNLENLLVSECYYNKKLC